MRIKSDNAHVIFNPSAVYSSINVPTVILIISIIIIIIIVMIMISCTIARTFLDLTSHLFAKQLALVVEMRKSKNQNSITWILLLFILKSLIQVSTDIYLVKVSATIPRVIHKTSSLQMFPIKGQTGNILEFVGHTVSVTLLNSAIAAQKQPWAIHKQMNMAMCLLNIYL